MAPIGPPLIGDTHGGGTQGHIHITVTAKSVPPWAEESPYSGLSGLSLPSPGRWPPPKCHAMPCHAHAGGLEHITHPASWPFGPTVRLHLISSHRHRPSQ